MVFEECQKRRKCWAIRLLNIQWANMMEVVLKRGDG